MPAQAHKIALVAGEASSDLLGATLIHDLKARDHNVQILAVGGARIRQTGVEMIMDNEVFSVMGLSEVLRDLPKILRHKKAVVAQITAFQPDVFIGVDSPDLNFSIAKGMRQNNIPVIHYVSPSVWAWRPKRIFKMERFIDHLLTLFPFEVDLYQSTRIRASFVGHPLAQQIPVDIDKAAEKHQLGLSGQRVLALLPGSRNREIKTLLPVFAQTIKQLELGQKWVVMSSNVNRQKVALATELLEQQGLEQKAQYQAKL